MPQSGLFNEIFFRRNHDIVLEKIFSYLDEMSALNMATVCKAMVALVKNNPFLIKQVRNCADYARVASQRFYLWPKRLQQSPSFASLFNDKDEAEWIEAEDVYRAPIFGNVRNVLTIFKRNEAPLNTALVIAALSGNLPVVKHLVEVTGLVITDNDVLFAAKNMQMEVFRYFISRGFDCCSYFRAQKHQLIEFGLQFSIVGLVRFGLEDLGLEKPRYDLFKFFRRVSGGTVLSSTKAVEILTYLKDELSCDINQVDPDTGDTPLLALCNNISEMADVRQAQLFFIDALGEKGADMNVKNKAGKTAFDLLFSDRKHVTLREVDSLLFMAYSMISHGARITLRQVMHWIYAHELPHDDKYERVLLSYFQVLKVSLFIHSRGLSLDVPD